ncbi:MAG: hypothetical protein HQL03_03285 [Nitrospirae bacterium]|nr:hypothetical protein [Nitrospirota bacterium]
MMSLFGRFKLWQRFALICILFTIPIIILLYLLVSEKNIAINFASKELDGTQYLRPLKTLYEDTLKHKFLTHKYLSGDNAVKADITALSSRIEEDFNRLDDVDKSLGETLNSTEKYNAVKNKWRSSVKDAASLVAVQKSDDVNDDLIASMKALISHVGDKSNLILDPDIDNFYLMDTVVVKLSDAASLIYDIQVSADDVIRKRSVTQDEKTGFIVKTGLLKSDIEAVDADMVVAFRDNPLGNIRPKLEETLKGYDTVINGYLNTVEKDLLKPGSIVINAKDFSDAVVKGMETSKMQNETKVAILAIETGSKKVEAGTDLSIKAGNSLNEIVKSINSLQTMTQQIATATQELSCVTEQVGRDIESISTAAEKTNTSANKIHKASDNLEGLSRELTDSTSLFKLPRLLIN